MPPHILTEAPSISCFKERWGHSLKVKHCWKLKFHYLEGGWNPPTTPPPVGDMVNVIPFVIYRVGYPNRIKANCCVSLSPLTNCVYSLQYHQTK